MHVARATVHIVLRAGRTRKYGRRRGWAIKFKKFRANLFESCIVQFQFLKTWRNSLFHFGT